MQTGEEAKEQKAGWDGLFFFLLSCEQERKKRKKRRQQQSFFNNKAMFASLPCCMVLRELTALQLQKHTRSQQITSNADSSAVLLKYQLTQATRTLALKKPDCKLLTS